MRELVLLRHAHSIVATQAIDDFDRPLSKEGKQQAASLAKQLKKRHFSAQWIVSSAALRALETAKTVAAALHYSVNKIENNKKLYLASPEQIIETIAELPENKHHIILVGHNPGLSQTCRMLAEPHLGELTPAAAYLLQWENSTWQEIINNNIRAENVKLLIGEL